MESAGDGCAPEVQLPERRPTTSPCRKKKEPDAGFLDDVKDHLDQFVSTSMDQHRICLKKTIRGMSDYVKLRKQRKAAAAASDSSSSSSSNLVTESNSGSKNAEMASRQD
ncbi:uncharacterized protein LOC121973511 [Zingiber officinale]|uniref:uncharacterized protein LOC121973511 n=1 Tax=Zingiber officinale TaxID=94328 RepID=UPI001C4AC151|nr:uncharacterized protein LOC121973511 [Zingiber officinale]